MLGTRNHPNLATDVHAGLSAEEKRTVVHFVSALCVEVSKVDQLLVSRCGSQFPPVKDARQALEALKSQIASLPIADEDTFSR